MSLIKSYKGYSDISLDTGDRVVESGLLEEFTNFEVDSNKHEDLLLRNSLEAFPIIEENENQESRTCDDYGHDRRSLNIIYEEPEPEIETNLVRRTFTL